MEHPDILFLSETKLTTAHLSPTIKRLGFSHYHIVPSCNKSGGLARHGSINITVILACKHLIHTSSTDHSGSCTWKASFFYGNRYSKYKAHCCNILSQQVYTPRCPWLIIGDFNLTLSPHNKEGGNPFCHINEIFSQ